MMNANKLIIFIYQEVNGNIEMSAFDGFRETKSEIEVIIMVGLCIRVRG